MLKLREESDSYLTQICRHPYSGDSPEKRSNMELSVNTVALISYRSRLTYVLAGATRRKKGSKGGGG